MQRARNLVEARVWRRLSVVSSLVFAAAAAALAAPAAAAPSAEEINAAAIENDRLPEGQSAITVKLQVLLDRIGASPGVIDGYRGENVEKAVRAAERMKGLSVDGVADAELLAAIDDGSPVIVEYTITADDLDERFVSDLPEDYGELAQMEWLGFRGPAEMLAERFHMDIDLFHALNPSADFGSAGTVITVADPGSGVEGSAAKIEADKSLRQVRALDDQGALLAAYPATIGSAATPSPSGTHTVTGIAIDPTYTYRPDENFRQGDNTEPLTLPPGPNGPVGSVWIDLSEPTYGLHGAPEPAEIDKTQSHGCVRLTNWDARELAGLVAQGTPVAFLD